MEGLKKFKTIDAYHIVEDIMNFLPELRKKAVLAGFPSTKVSVLMGDTPFIEPTTSFHEVYSVDEFTTKFPMDKEKFLGKGFGTYVFVGLEFEGSYWSPELRIYFDSVKKRTASFIIDGIESPAEDVFDEESDFGECDNGEEPEFSFTGNPKAILDIFNESMQEDYYVSDIDEAAPLAAPEENVEHEQEFLEICVREYNKIVETRDFSQFVTDALEAEMNDTWHPRLLSFALLPSGDSLRDDKFLDGYLALYRKKLANRIKEWEGRAGQPFPMSMTTPSILDAADMM